MQFRKKNAVFVSRRRYADRKHRKPQRAFSVDILGGVELDDTKDTWYDDGAIQALDVPLTTNKPREVEMINPETGLRERLFESCSAAARLTNINRTKVSRMCRSGGGRLGKYIFQYVEQQQHQAHEKMTEFHCSMYSSSVLSCSSQVSTSVGSAEEEDATSTSFIPTPTATTNHSNELDAVEALLSMVVGCDYEASGGEKGCCFGIL